MAEVKKKEKTLAEREREADKIIAKYKACNANESSCSLGDALYEIEYTSDCCNVPKRFCRQHAEAWVFQSTEFTCQHCSSRNHRENLLRVERVDD